MFEKKYYVYMLTNKTNRVLYIGVTNNLSRRISDHQKKMVKGFTAKYNIYKLVYYETFENIYEAISREKQFKNWHRTWKMNLIKKYNPDFKDLVSEL